MIYLSQDLFHNQSLVLVGLFRGSLVMKMKRPAAETVKQSCVFHQENGNELKRRWKGAAL